MPGLPLALPLAVEPTSIGLAAGNYTIVVVILLLALGALAVAGVFGRQVLAAPEGTENMRTIAAAVQEGANAYLRRQFRTLAGFVVLVFFLLFLLPGELDVKVGRSVFFVLGALFSAVVGYVGMWLATRANVRVAAAAREPGGAPVAMRIAFRTGGVVGMLTVGLGLAGAALVVLLFRGDAPSATRRMTTTMV